MNDFELGRHEEAITRLSKQVSGMDTKLDMVLDTLAEKRGERKMFALLATAAGGAGSLIITLVLKLWGHS